MSNECAPKSRRAAYDEEQSIALHGILWNSKYEVKQSPLEREN